MTVRTTSKTVTFHDVFTIAGHREKFPAGNYCIETDEELIEGLSFPAYRRLLTLLCFDAKASGTGVTQFLNIDPDELDAALERDRVGAGEAAAAAE